MTDVTEPESRRSAFSLATDRTYGPFLAGKVLSSCGNWVSNLAAAVLMFELTGSAFMVGSVSAVQFAGPLVLALWVGSLADRRDRRMLLIVGRSLMAFAVATLAVLLGLRGVDGFGGPPVLLACVLVIGVGMALSNPSTKALVPALVPPRDLEQAFALASAAPSLARTIGPSLGAGLLLLGGPPLAFSVAAGAHAVFVCALLSIRARPRVAVAGRPRVFGGFAYLWQDRKSGLLMVGVAMLGVGVDPLITLTPSLAAALGGDAGSVGVLVTSFGTGAVVVTLTFARLRRILTLRWIGISGFWIFASGWLMAGLAPSLYSAAAAFFIGGVGYLMASVALNTRIVRRVPDELRGRVMAIWGLAFVGSRPIAALASGSLADATTAQTALLLLAVLMAVSSLLPRVKFGEGA